MESDHELMVKLLDFLKLAFVDMHINNAAFNGELSLLREKCRSGDYLNIEEALKDFQRASHSQGYNDGMLKMAADITNLLD